MNKDLKKKATILYKKYDWGLRKIGEKIGKSHEYVRTLLGPDIVRTRRKLNISIDKLQKMFDKTESYQEVADKFDVTRQYVYNRLSYNTNGNKKRKPKVKAKVRVRTRQRQAV